MISQKLNLLTNVLLGLAFIICIFSGFFIRTKLGIISLRDVHLFSAYTLIVLVIIHLILHYEWIKEIPIFLKGNKKKLTGKN